MYVWLGLCDVLVPLSPKFHDQDVIDPVDVSVKLTGSGATPFIGFAVKLAAHGAMTVMVPVFVFVDPHEFVTVRVTV